MTSFSIELYEETSLEIEIVPVDAMLKFNNQKVKQSWKILLLINLEKTLFLYNCVNLLLLIDNDQKTHNLSKQKHVACQSTWTVETHNWPT